MDGSAGQIDSPDSSVDINVDNAPIRRVTFVTIAMWQIESVGATHHSRLVRIQVAWCCKLLRIILLINRRSWHDARRSE